MTPDETREALRAALPEFTMVLDEFAQVYAGDNPPPNLTYGEELLGLVAPLASSYGTAVLRELDTVGDAEVAAAWDVVESVIAHRRASVRRWRTEYGKGNPRANPSA